jgi:hypothetical protein
MHLPMKTPPNDGWEDAAKEAESQILRGTLLKFADWNWTADKENVPVEKDRQLVAVSTAAGWVKWQDGKPVEYRMRAPGERMPEREDLGDDDEALWEAGPDGKPRDPWQNTRFVYLVDPMTAEAFTFSTSSWGGRSAVIDLSDQIKRMRTAYPDAVPVVELHAAPMKTKHGRKSKPLFRVIGWKSAIGDGSTAPVGTAPSGNGGTGPVKRLPAMPTAKEELDDEIPY